MSIHRLRLSAAPAVTLAAALGALWIAPTAKASPEREARVNLAQAVKRTLLLFPFDKGNASAAAAEEVTGLLTDMAVSRLSLSNSYAVTRYYKALPTVARLYSSQQLTDADINAPYADDNRKATKIAKLISYETAFLGSVDDYKFSEDDLSVELTVSGRILDIEKGTIIKSVTLSVTSAKGGKAKEVERAVEAAREAGEKLMTQLVPVVSTPSAQQPVVKPKPQPTAKKKNSMGWLWGVIAIGLGIGIGLASGGGGGGGGGDQPPAPPR